MFGYPNITGQLGWAYTSFARTDQQNGYGALRQAYPESEGWYVARISGGSNADIYINASLSNSTYATNGTVKPLSLVFNYVIKD